MGQELQDQSTQLDALQQQAEQTGQGLHSVTIGAAKLAGRAPKKRGAAGGSWGGEQDAALAAVSRAVVACAPVAARYSTRR